MTVLVEEETTHRRRGRLDEHVVEAFTCGDCWALALLLVETYQDLVLCVLANHDEEYEESIDWHHAFVKDTRTGKYVDVEGEHTFDELDRTWSWTNWEMLLEDPPRSIFLEELPRHYPEVPIEAGITRMIAHGWRPPNRRHVRLKRR